MKYKREIILSTIFIIFMLSFGSPVLAQYDWTSFGNGHTPLWNAQYTNSRGIFNSSTTFIDKNVGFGSIGHTQPLVSLLDSNSSAYGTREYLIIPIVNYLDIYNYNLDLIDEIYTGATLINQYGITDFDGNGFQNDIVGVFNVNGNLTFMAFTFQSSIQRYNLTASFNLSSNFTMTEVLGIRCSGESCYSVNQVFTTGYNWVENFTIYNRTGIFQKTLQFSNGTIINFSSSSVGSYRIPPAWADFNADGQTEYIIYTNRFVAVFNPDGNIIFYKTFPQQVVLDVKAYKGDTSPYWKLAILYTGTSADLNHLYLDSYNIISGESIFWTKTFSLSPSAYGITYIAGALAITDDYDFDYARYDNDIYLAYSWFVSASGTHINYYVLKGYNGNTLSSYSSPILTGTSNDLASLTIADMDNDGYKDFIFSQNDNRNNITIYNPYTNSFIFNNYFLSPTTYRVCIPADINIDSYLELICSLNGYTQIFYNSGLANQNPDINSITYEPSTTIAINSWLNIYVNASDSDLDTIYYSVKCDDSSSWSIDTTSSTSSCYYNSIGHKNNQIRVKDEFHSTYNYFSQDILVTETGIFCNNNGICEEGETNSNCPNDCPIGINTTQATEIGGMPLPTKIVDTENTEQGLLPEIYYGILAFLSGTLTPMIILIFTIFFVLIILSVGFIIKKIAHRVGDLSR